MTSSSRGNKLGMWAEFPVFFIGGCILILFNKIIMAVIA